MKRRYLSQRLYLSEDQLPKQWYNLRADMKELPDPMLNLLASSLPLQKNFMLYFARIGHQELDNTTRYFDIPEEIQEFYKMYRPSPLIRAYHLEKALGTPAKIYYKYEGNNTSGSHKLNLPLPRLITQKSKGYLAYYRNWCRPMGNRSSGSLFLF